MNHILSFAVAFLTTFSTINAVSLKVEFEPYSTMAMNDARTGSRLCTYNIHGQTLKIPNVPRQCCNRDGRLYNNVMSRSGYGQSECQMVCPILKALKGCSFTCEFHICKDLCNKECKCIKYG